MTQPLFTVLLPVRRPPALLPYAVRSVLAQSCAELELFIVCDGAPAATVEAARDFAAADPRVRVFPHPKGERHGEAWRHQALQQACGRYICQIGDDDLWFPDHLAEAARLMEVADFGNLLSILLTADGAPRVQLADLALPVVQGAMLNARYNSFGPTSAVYRLETYRALPLGWSPAPPDLWSDLFMWRKFLTLPGIRAATRPVATSLSFPASLRAGASLEQREAETTRCAALMRDPGFRDQLWRQALLALAAEIVGLRQQGFRSAQAAEAARAEAAGLAAVLSQVAARAGDSDAQTRLAQAALDARV